MATGGDDACFNCGKPGHFSRNCPDRGPSSGTFAPRGGRTFFGRGRGMGMNPRGRGGRFAAALTCFNCGRPGHFARECRAPQNLNGGGMGHSGPMCYNCGLMGHISRDCRKPRIAPDACYRCGESGHKARECTQEPAPEQEGGRRGFAPRGSGGYGRGRGGMRPRILRCFNCGERDHLARDCKTERPPEGERLCWNCKDVGHIGRECPKKKDEAGEMKASADGGEKSE